ncbi:MAG: type I-E CRISPR-associated protein Cas6/Cse3/CasE [Nitrospirae bacterium]|nr:type I-E CRISPR-associated protein Cas6/Cse3/CasE [Nitrospirota bacterium]MBI5675616.1 type I-E CRISPR-associated protein Cas6/Cse3/CasE [Nitrospirota bacterium]
MFLSKVLITGAACRNPYEIHRAVWELFPVNAVADRDFLFRVEKSDGRQAEILMQSVREPINNQETAQIIACRAYPMSLRSEQRLRFLLVANPVKTINDERGRQNAKGEIKKCRVPLIDDESQRAWLVRKLENAASLESLIVDNKLPLYFRKLREDRAGKIQPVMYQGILQVQKADIFQKVILHGIGPAKAFGCGLLSLARA